MDYRTIDDMYDRGTLVQADRFVDAWTRRVTAIEPPSSSISKCWGIRARSAGKKTVRPSARNTTAFTPWRSWRMSKRQRLSARMFRSFA